MRYSLRMNTEHEITEMPHVRDTWVYRGVPFVGSTGSWQTYSCIKVGGQFPGVRRFRAVTRPALLRLIDKHLDSGGELSL
jgi:hypothetical protein